MVIKKVRRLQIEKICSRPKYNTKKIKVSSHIRIVNGKRVRVKSYKKTERV